MKTYVISPDARTSRYYAQAFGLDLDPQRTILLGSSHALPVLMGVGAGEFYVVNADNGAIAVDVVRQLLMLEAMHPESVTVEWIGFGEEGPLPTRDEDTDPSPPQSPWYRRPRPSRW